jgi:hypothetical protein
MKLDERLLLMLTGSDSPESVQQALALLPLPRPRPANDADKVAQDLQTAFRKLLERSSD